MNPCERIPSPRPGRRTAGVLLLAAIMLFLNSFLSPVQAAGDTATTEQAEVTLLGAVTGAGQLGVLPFGIRLRLQPGWKTYWRSPGDAGFAPEVTVSGSRNVASAVLSFPVPHRFELFGLQTFGYGDEVVLPLAIVPETPGAPVQLRVRLRYLVCEQVCIPYEHDLALDLPAGPAAPGPDAAAISRFQSLVPDDGTRARFSIESAGMDADALVVRLASGGAPLEHPDAIVEAPAGLYFGKPAVEVVDGGAAAVLSLPLTRDGNAPDPATSEITLTAFDGERALERKLVLATFTGVGPAAVVPALLPMILVALLGGLILNAMPCVLPVLVLKLSSVLEQAGVAAADTRRSFLATAAGIMTAFVTLGTILIGIRLAGYGVGWGIQFQQPLFLALLAAICLAFAANVWGWFEIGVPGFAGALANAADRQPGKPLRGAFLNGVLASVLATPCSAPFVGVAVGYALSRGTGEILVIFLALGAGLAAPYFTIAAMPGLVAWLPRPGRWMLWLKRLLGVSLAGMGLWLLFILGGIAGVLPATGPGLERIAWQKFDASTIPGLVDSGHVVFVDVTADWCLTCRANKEFVLSRDPVASALGGIVAMKADWTSPDPEISAYLARFGRYGIPMNVVYGPGAPDGILLPELLGSDAVIAALEKAK